MTFKEDIKKLEYTTERKGVEGEIFLDANESPYQWVNLENLQLDQLNRYPCQDASDLRRELSDKYVPSFVEDQILVSSGSIELIDLAIRSFCDRNQELMIVHPCYSIYELRAKINRCKIKKIPVKEDFSLNIQKIKDQIRDVKLMILGSPNNPTGKLITKKEIEEILNFYKGILIIDEAYVEFAGIENSLQYYALTHSNVLIFRTFSKAWGLAGIRLGYCLGSTKLIKILKTISNPYNVSRFAQRIGIKALEQSDQLKKHVENINSLKNELVSNLHFSGIQVKNTDANFILVQVRDPQFICEKLKAQGILVRNQSNQPSMEGIIRISIGSRIENMLVVKEIVKHSKWKLLNTN